MKGDIVKGTPTGFAQRVTGCGDGDKRTEKVETGAELEQAVQTANELRHTPFLILVGSEAVVEPPDDAKELILTIAARNLTVYGQPGSTLRGIGFVFDGTTADNVVLQNLTLQPLGTDDQDSHPSDGLVFATVHAKASTGYWIDHCTFDAFPDQCMQTDAKVEGPEALLLGVSNCRFTGNPAWVDQGSIEISGLGDKHGEPDKDTVAVYASVNRNYFDQSRRRAPRSSEYTFVHAFNNVLENWGAGDGVKQSNGMQSGNRGRLAALANWFYAGDTKLAIEVADDDRPGRLEVHDEPANRLRNYYENGAIAPSTEDELDIKQQYKSLNLEPPEQKAMSEPLATEIEQSAGATLGHW